MGRGRYTEFRTLPEDTPPDNDDPGDPPSTRSVDAPDQPQPEIETTPMLRPGRKDRNAEVDFQG